MKVKFNDLYRQFERYKNEYEEKAVEVLNSGWYILGKEVSAFEDEFSKFVGTKHCVGVASGLDAIVLAFRALGIGKNDEVIVQANAYIASVMGITINGAKPVFVEPDEYYSIDESKIEAAITKKTRAILVVHLYGQAAKMNVIKKLCEKYNLYLVEDCAQSHGAMFNNQMTGTFGHIGCFSFYPSKNLGAFGDGGAIVTNNEKISNDIKILRNYGSEKRYYNSVIGYNSRLDEIQGGLLRIKLRHLEELNKERERLCNRYLNEIKNPRIKLPRVRKGAKHAWHMFVVYVENRDLFKEYLNKNGIETEIHYPIPPYLSEAYEYLGIKLNDYPLTEDYMRKILSLPLYNGMKNDEINYVINTINKFTIL